MSNNVSNNSNLHRSRKPQHLDWEQNLPSHPIWPPISFLSSDFPIQRPRNLFLIFAYDFEQIFRPICPILLNISDRFGKNFPNGLDKFRPFWNGQNGRMVKSGPNKDKSLFYWLENFLKQGITNIINYNLVYFVTFTKMWYFQTLVF